jgi:2-polyprenyl-3-methyl-5-hydroxy-6-metoxy-1,4-benzoquinol methylase
LKLARIPLVNRDDWILGKVRGKRVLHAGATDSPLSARRASLGELLHQKLNRTDCKVIGVDLDADAIDVLRREHGIENILHGNLEHIDRLFPHRSFDVVLAADILEHLDNPGLFLAAARSLLAPDGVLIVTVPNAFSFKKFVGVSLFLEERNHPDHVCYYSPMTLQQALARHRFDITESCSFLNIDQPPRRINRFANSVARVVMGVTNNHNIADEWALCARALAGAQGNSA